MLQPVDIQYAYKKFMAAQKSKSEIQLARPESGSRKFAAWGKTLQGFYETFHDQFQRTHPRFPVPPMSDAFSEGESSFNNIAAVASSKDGSDMVQVSRALGKIYFDRVHHLHGQGSLPAGGGGGLDKSLQPWDAPHLRKKYKNLELYRRQQEYDERWRSNLPSDKLAELEAARLYELAPEEPTVEVATQNPRSGGLRHVAGPKTKRPRIPTSQRDPSVQSSSSKSSSRGSTEKSMIRFLGRNRNQLSERVIHRYLPEPPRRDPSGQGVSSSIAPRRGTTESLDAYNMEPEAGVRKPSDRMFNRVIPEDHRQDLLELPPDLLDLPPYLLDLPPDLLGFPQDPSENLPMQYVDPSDLMDPQHLHRTPYFSSVSHEPQLQSGFSIYPQRTHTTTNVPPRAGRHFSGDPFQAGYGQESSSLDLGWGYGL